MSIVTKDSIQKIILSEYEKSQKNIQPEWLGEGWYIRTRNSFNYFASGFEAGMEYSKQQNIGEQLMTIGELLKILTQEARDYRKKCVDSINNNRHMNNCHGECKIMQNEVDAVLVGFINNIGVRRGVDYALYTEDLENK